MIAPALLPLARSCFALAMSSSADGVFAPQPPSASATASSMTANRARRPRAAASKELKQRLIDRPPGDRLAALVPESLQQLLGFRAPLELLAPAQQLLQLQARGSVGARLHVCLGEIEPDHLRVRRQRARF